MNKELYNLIKTQALAEFEAGDDAAVCKVLNAQSTPRSPDSPRIDRWIQEVLGIETARVVLKSLGMNADVSSPEAQAVLASFDGKWPADPSAVVTSPAQDAIGRDLTEGDVAEARKWFPEAEKASQDYDAALDAIAVAVVADTPLVEGGA